MKTQNLTHLLENGNIIYKGINIELTPDQIFDLKIHLGKTTFEVLEIQYKSILELRREQNLEILLD